MAYFFHNTGFAREGINEHEMFRQNLAGLRDELGSPELLAGSVMNVLQRLGEKSGPDGDLAEWNSNMNLARRIVGLSEYP